jgi:hypothetical protein
MVRKSVTVLVVGGCVLATAGCTGSSSVHSPLGVVTGASPPCLAFAVRPAVLARIKVPITLTGSDGDRRVQTITKPWRFSYTVPVGEYVVSTPGATPVTVHVMEGKAMHVQIVKHCI